MAAFVKGSASATTTAATKATTTTTTTTAEGAPAPTSYVAIILDITGSMGSQIQGVKNAVRELIPILAKNPRLGIVIITFAEGGRCVCMCTAVCRSLCGCFAGGFIIWYHNTPHIIFVPL